MELRKPSRIALLGAALVAGCAAVGMARLEPGRSTEADVRHVLGEPARTYAGRDGARQLAFTTGPAGTQTYMAFLRPRTAACCGSTARPASAAATASASAPARCWR